MSRTDCLLVAVVSLILAASVAFGGPACPPYVCKPAVITHAAPVAFTHHHKQILFADVYVPLFDEHAKDVFVFYGAPAFSVAPTPVAALGVDAQGRELTAPLSSPALAPAAAFRPLGGYEGEAAKAGTGRPAAEKLASLKASCYDCHGGGRSRGGFTLFDGSGAVSSSADWKLIKEEIDSGRMPKPDARKPPVSAADREEIRRLAGG